MFLFYIFKYYQKPILVCVRINNEAFTQVFFYQNSFTGFCEISTLKVYGTFFKLKSYQYTVFYYDLL